MSRHQWFDAVLASLKNGAVSQETLASVLIRVMVAAPDAVVRADIARGKGLSKPSPLKPSAVSKAVQVLREPHGIEVGTGTRMETQTLPPLLKQDEKLADQSRAGRPVDPLRLHPDTWGLVGLHILNDDQQPSQVHGVVTRLDGSVLDHGQWQLADVANSEKLAAELATIVTELTDKVARLDAGQGVHDRRLLGVGVNIAGHVHNGHIIGVTHMGLGAGEHWSLEEPLQDQVDLPVVMDNDINLLAVRENYSPTYNDRDLSIVAVLPDGVGAGMILNGHVYRGGGGMAGELGHQTVSICADVPEYLAAEVQERPFNSFGDKCECQGKNHVDCFTTPSRLTDGAGASTFAQAAASPAYSDQGAFTRAGWAFQIGGRALGQGIASLVNIVNPSRVVVRLPSELAETKPYGSTAAARYLGAMEEALDEYSFSNGATTARAGNRALTIESLTLDTRALDVGHENEGAVVAAIRVLDAFIMHARGKDSCSCPGRSST